MTDAALQTVVKEAGLGPMGPGLRGARLSHDSLIN